MDSPTSFVNFAIPYVLICGSYQRSRTNDKLCEVLGNKIGKHNIGIVSAGGKPGIKIGQSINKTLTDSGQYEPTKILTVYRKKDPEDELKVRRVGCTLFVGNTLDELRSYLFSKSKVMIVIGGSSKTKEEIRMAQELKLSVIPIGMTGGVAYTTWLEYHQAGQYHDAPSFLKLNNSNPAVATSAVMRSLVDLAFVE